MSTPKKRRTAKRKAPPAPPPRKPERPHGWRVTEEEYAVDLGDGHSAMAKLQQQDCCGGGHPGLWRYMVFLYRPGPNPHRGSYVTGYTLPGARAKALKLGSAAVHMALAGKPPPKAADASFDCQACRADMDRKIKVLLAQRPRPGVQVAPQE